MAQIPLKKTVRPAATATGFERFARAVLRHRRLVATLAVVIGVAGVFLAGPIAGRLDTTTSFPGLPSVVAGQAVLRDYGNGGNVSPIVVSATLPPGARATTAEGGRLLARTFAPFAALRSLRVLDYPEAHDPRLVSTDGRSALALVYSANPDAPTSAELAAKARAAAPAGVTVAATSLQDLYHSPGHGSVGVLGETIIGAIGALVVLVVVFGSLLAVVPLLIAVVSILATLLALGAVTFVTPVSVLVEYVVSLIGLGIAIDYSLLVVTRWRDERQRGLDNEDAVVAAMATAGRTVALSGVTVAVGLFTLVALPIGFLRTLGFAGLLIPLMTVVAALTLLPVLLASFGPRLDRRARRRRAKSSVPDPLAGAWARWTGTVIRHRRLAILAAAAVLGIFIGAAFSMRVGEVVPTSVSLAGPAESGLQALQREGFPVSVLQPMEVLVPDRDQPAHLTAELSSLPGVDTAVSPAGAAWHRDGTTLVDVIPKAATSAGDDPATVSAVRAAVARSAPGAQVAGDPPEESDTVNAYYARFPLILLIVAAVTLIALARAFRSWVLAVKALLLNVVSVTAAYGALVLIWQDGLGSRAIWGFPATGDVIDFVPLVLFAFLFGLSMDYEVFILSRVKEAHDSGMSTDEAVVYGLGRTGRLVTSAAVILFLAFAALASGPSVPIKIFATGMAVGILLDATVIRALLLPALLSTLGERAWWAPGRFSRARRSDRRLAPSQDAGDLPRSPTNDGAPAEAARALNVPSSL